MFNNIYNNRKVLITGHSGFKGSWLVLWLQFMGAKIFGYSLKPETDPNHYDLLNINTDEKIADIRDYNTLKNWIQYCSPEIIFHLAAQPLVLRSYKEPIYTLETNILGTANLLEACKNMDSIRVIIIITSDKCYKNNEQIWAYRENDPMGGYDIYSASKGCVELITESYRKSFFNQNDIKNKQQTLIASCRAGNVIGGGDWAENRLIPDIMKSANNNKKVTIRNPFSIRPWQHVLDPLSGYLLLGQYLLEGKSQYADSWNFGPDKNDITVKDVIEYMRCKWKKIKYQINSNKECTGHETGVLKLDCTKAKSILKWEPVWDYQKAFNNTVDWYRNYYEKNTSISNKQLSAYLQDASSSDVTWIK